MADKLPPIYLHNGTAEYLATAPKSAHLSVNCSMSPSKYALTMYEPAVPRCKTCPHWNPPFIREEKHYPSRCDFFQRWMKHEDDGSGYCSNHPEAKT